MNDPVIERVAREDPVRHGAVPDRTAPADATLQRVLAMIDANNGDSLRRSRSESPSFVAGPLRRRRAANRRFAGGVGLVAAVLVVAAIAAVALDTLGRHQVVTGPARHVHRGPAGGDAVVRAVPAGSVKVGSGPASLLSSGGSLWVAGRGFVARLDPSTGETKDRIAVSSMVVGPAQLAAGAGSIWAAYQGPATVLRIDPRTNRVATITLGRDSDGGGVAFAGGRIWVSRDASGAHGDVVTVDPRVDRLIGAPVSVGSGPDELSAGRGSVWVQNTSGPYPGASRIDPRTRRSRSEPFSGMPAFGFGSVWVVPDGADVVSSVLRYHLATRRATPVARLPEAVAVAFGAGRVWVVSYPRSGPAATYDPIKGTATLTEIDPRTNQIVGSPIRLNALQPLAVAVAGRNLWIADYSSGKLLHFRLER